MPEVLDRSLLCATPIFKVEVDTVQMEDQTVERAVVRKRPCVGILALNDQDEIMLVSQYRHPVGCAIYEIPAGAIDPGEEPHRAARRELEEECGLQCASLNLLGSIVVSPGWTDEAIYLYLAERFTITQQRLDDEERITCEWVDLRTAHAWIVQGKIQDAKTISALTFLMGHLASETP